jgi:large subunit ribosomal protein L13
MKSDRAAKDSCGGTFDNADDVQVLTETIGRHPNIRVTLYNSRRYHSMKTFMASPATIERKWYVVDAEGKTLGRLASEIAKVLRGKNKPTFTPHMDTGDYVIVVNADKVKVTGKKLEQKIYYHHSDYVGGMKETTLKVMLADKPERVIELAVKGMLPKGPLGRQMYKKLFVYAGPEHKHAAQKPEVLTF